MLGLGLRHRQAAPDCKRDLTQKQLPKLMQLPHLSQLELAKAHRHQLLQSLVKLQPQLLLRLGQL